jgi:cardiolipin synthase
MVPGNKAELLKNGDRIFPAMTRDIRAAKRTVNLETYIFQPDEAGRQIAEAMIDAAQRGVEVRFLIDSWGSKLGDLEQPLKAAGVHVRKYRPVRLFSIYKVGKRTHRKILVVDGRVAYTGGVGLSKEWLGDARNAKEWRETQVRVEGPVVAQMRSSSAKTGPIQPERFSPGIGSIRLPSNGGALAQAVKASAET